MFVTYDARQILFWMFNPYYEQYIDAESLHIVRNTICSTEFWEYVQEYLGKRGRGEWRVKELGNTVKKMLKSQKALMARGLMEQDTVDLMKNVSDLLEEI